MSQKSKIYCRTAPSLGALNNSPVEIWGTEEYSYQPNKNDPTVFFGLYDLRDYIALWRHKGKAWVLWAGSDIENLVNGFIFNDGKLKWISRILRGNWWLKYILKKADHYVESADEWNKLMDWGLPKPTSVIPSFLGRAQDFPVSYKQAFHPNVYISAHEGREEEYGVDYIKKIAKQVPECIFHIYGVSKDGYLGRELKNYFEGNIVWHGKVSNAKMNAEIKHFQCGLRLNSSDGFSEITAKSILMGQYAITRLRYPMIPNFETDRDLVSLLKSLRTMNKPNHAARNYYLNSLNRYPWVKAENFL
jgi:hypothetical protein